MRFLGTFQYVIDRKNRLTLPIPFREAMSTLDQTSFVMSKNVEPHCLTLHPYMLWKHSIGDPVSELLHTDEKANSLRRLLGMNTTETEIDNQGRVYIPGEFMVSARIKEFVMLIGKIDTIQIWNPQVFEQVSPKVPTEIDFELSKLNSLIIDQEQSDQITHVPKIRVVPATQQILELLRKDIKQIFNLTADQFEMLVCDRLYEMGFAVERVGSVYARDGGVDIVACSRDRSAFPFIIGVQAKHHKHPKYKTGPSPVKELQTVIDTQPFNAGLLVTNTTFTPHAHWFAEKRHNLIRLRDLIDLSRWIMDNFLDEEESREIPEEIELCPGVRIRIPR